MHEVVETTELRDEREWPAVEEAMQSIQLFTIYEVVARDARSMHEAEMPEHLLVLQRVDRVRGMMASSFRGRTDPEELVHLDHRALDEVAYLLTREAECGVHIGLAGCLEAEDLYLGLRELGTSLVLRWWPLPLELAAYLRGSTPELEAKRPETHPGRIFRKRRDGERVTSPEPAGQRRFFR